MNRFTRKPFAELLMMFLIVLGVLCSFDPGPVRAQTPLPEWVSIQQAEDCSNGCWDLVEVRYLDEGESAGLHHVFARTRDAQGNYIPAPFVLGWADGQTSATTKVPPDWGDIAMWDCFFPDQGEVGGYSTWAGAWRANSDVVSGLGLPYCRHESIQLTWQWRNGGESPTPTPTATVAPLPERLYLPAIWKR